VNDKYPKASIITVCFNSENVIEKTIKSVINQTYPNVEYILIDGKSTDNTMNIIKKYESSINIIISEKDNGTYDAMNKGAQVASGDLIYYLNSGDYLYDDFLLEKAVNEAEKNSFCEILYGDILYYDKDSSEYHHGPKNNIFEIMSRGINHQSIFARKSAFEKCGYFDTKYKIFSDYDWLLRCLTKHNIKTYKIEIPIAYYLKGGLSDNYGEEYVYEKYEIFTKYAKLNNFLRYARLCPFEFFCYLRYRLSLLMD
jgi:glycosyltransferase involved in cell wall biosynthesis